MTHDLSDRLSRAKQHIDPGFAGARVEQALASFTRRLERRRQAKRALAAGSLTVSVLAVLFGLQLHGEQQLAERNRTVQTEDGSRARLLEDGTELQVQQDSESEVALTLARGAGHFEVTPRAARRYRVHAGPVDVQVLGTVFDVKRRGERSLVTVTRGAVQVSWPGGQTVLHAGDSEWFPRPDAAPKKADIVQPSAAAEPSAAEPSAAEPAVAQAASTDPVVPADVVLPVEQLVEQGTRHDAWRSLERAGRHKEAFRSLDRARGKRVDDLEGLLLAADAARLSDHPRQAAKYLERLVRKYPDSAPARLGVFTLGGLLLQELHAPARAARSFARAYQLDPDGPLAEDALARQAEAELKAGLRERAAKSAERYLTRYPQGTRRAELTRYLDAQ